MKLRIHLYSYLRPAVSPGHVSPVSACTFFILLVSSSSVFPLPPPPSLWCCGAENKNAVVWPKIAHVLLVSLGSVSARERGESAERAAAGPV